MKCFVRKLLACTFLLSENSRKVEIEEGLRLDNLSFVSQSMQSFFGFQYGGSKWLTLVLQVFQELLFEKGLE